MEPEMPTQSSAVVSTNIYRTDDITTHIPVRTLYFSLKQKDVSI